MSDSGAGFRLRLLHRLRHVRRHPRLSVATALGIVLYFVLPVGIGETPRLLAAFDGAAVGFLAAIWMMMAHANPAEMRRRARLEDEGRHVVLALGAAVASAILLAIGFELHGIRDRPAGDASIRVVLAGATILLAWFFMNTMFALHYAHSFYGDGEARGLAFPGRAEPDYGDFLYFSFVIGMTFQVSDVAIESHRLRRIGLAHDVLAFFFNVIVLALAVNIIAGLI